MDKVTSINTNKDQRNMIDTEETPHYTLARLADKAAPFDSDQAGGHRCRMQPPYMPCQGGSVLHYFIPCCVCFQGCHHPSPAQWAAS